VFFAFVYTRITDSRRRIQAVTRWGAATLWWVLVTQWFFGAPIMDRGFTLTGGKCFMPAETESPKVSQMFTTSFECRTKGGKWVGGHDLSGHIFMLTLASLLLLLEVLPVAFRDYDKEDAPAPVEDKSPMGVWSLRSVGILSALWWWMLLMTSVFFHTWHEKLTGFIFALAGVYAIYVLPRSVSAVHGVLGRPGA